MPQLAWRNDADGFAFLNSWSFDSTERAALTAIAQPLVPAVVATVAAIIPDPLLLTAVAIAASGYTAFGPLGTYGLCGGMAYSALDHWNVRVPIPRGAHDTDNPERTAPASAAIRASLWNRLMDSLLAGGVLARTLEWTVLLNQVPAWLGGGGEALRNRSLQEWNVLRNHLDAGRPWPIGLIYTRRSLWEQHQILVHGYEINGFNQVTLFVYDSNAPAQFGDLNRSRVTLYFRGPTLVAMTPSDTPPTLATPGAPASPGDTLAGFFCSNYAAAAPVGMSKQFGEFQRWTTSRRTWMVTDGARMPVADARELSTLGGSTSVRGAGIPFTNVVVRPRDGACFKEPNSDPVYLYAGGAPFWIPDPMWMDRFGGFGVVRVVPDTTLATFVGPPDEGTLLREWSDPKVWLINKGARRWVTTPTELVKWGGFPFVRVVPDGGLKSIPVGAPLPTPGANECATLKAKVAALDTQIAKLLDNIDNLEGRQLAAARAALLRARSARAAALGRAGVLDCP